MNDSEAKQLTSRSHENDNMVDVVISDAAWVYILQFLLFFSEFWVCISQFWLFSPNTEFTVHVAIHGINIEPTQSE